MIDKENLGKADWSALGEIIATEMDSPTNSYVNGILIDIDEHIIEVDPTKCVSPTLEEIQTLQKCKKTVGVYRIV